MAGVKTLSPLLPGEKRFCGRRALGPHWCRGSYFGGSGTGSRVPTNVGPTMQKLSRQAAADHDTLEQDKPLSLIPSEIKKPCPAEIDNCLDRSHAIRYSVTNSPHHGLVSTCAPVCQQRPCGQLPTLRDLRWLRNLSPVLPHVSSGGLPRGQPVSSEVNVVQNI